MALNSSNPVLSKTFNNDFDYQDSINSRPMTLEGTIFKTLGALTITLIAAAAAWFTGLGAMLLLPALFIGLGLGLWQSFAKKINPTAILAYAAVQGVFVGGLSSILESLYPGVVQTAVLATFATAFSMLFAYRVGWIKVTDKFRRIMVVALFGYLGFSLINLGFALFTGSSAYSTSFGWLIALFGVGLAAITLTLDFDYVEYGVREQLPAEFEWRAAFGLTASLIWLYVEILRLLSIFNRE